MWQGRSHVDCPLCRFQDTVLVTELIQAFLETHYRVHQDGPDTPTLTLRVGQASSDLAVLHRTHGVD